LEGKNENQPYISVSIELSLLQMTRFIIILLAHAESEMAAKIFADVELQGYP
jgi:hypothetical protein